VHEKRPLERDQRPFDDRQDGQGEDERKRKPQRRVYPERRSVCHLHGEDEAYNDVADDHDGEVRRRVVGAVVVQLLTAMEAGIDDFEIAPEHGALAAGRAFLGRSTQQRGQHWAGADRSAVVRKAASSVLHLGL
jgi:hypothetical protein